MAYIGNRPEQGNFRKCDAITTSATATYNLLVGGVAVNPNQNQCIVSLNGVVQSSGTSYTIASSQITFASALTSSDVIDFILILGDTLDVGTVSDDTISTAKIQTDAVTQAKIADEAIDEARMQISNAGSNGQFLSKQSGNTGGLTWADAGGTHTLVGSSASSSGTSSVSFNSIFSSTYDQYLILAHRLTTSDNNENVYVRMRASGSDLTGSNYNYIITGNKSNTTGTSNINVGYNNQAQWMFTRGIENTDAQGGGALSFHLFDPYDATYYTRAQGVSSLRKGTSGDLEVYTIGGQVESTTQFDGISIYPSGGTFEQHEIYIYGVKES